MTNFLADPVVDKIGNVSHQNVVREVNRPFYVAGVRTGDGTVH
jgi:hypothetical protein